MFTENLLAPRLEKALRAQLESCGEIYLVGGIIRDRIRNIPGNDIDFVVKQNAIPAARQIADIFKGKFYVLDQERGTGRALVEIDHKPMVVDFATFNGSTIFEDLQKRDFTINAIALNLADRENLYDPLHGIEDLKQAVLKPCSPESFNLDPVRTIRAVRFLQSLDLHLDDSTVKLIRKSVPLLKNVSAERKRDEVFRILETRDMKASLNRMREYGLWDEVFPGVSDLEKIRAAAPHVNNALEHSLQVITYCQTLLNSIRSGDCVCNNPYMTSGCELLGDFRKGLCEYLNHPGNPQRQYDGLLYLAGLYHDIGKLKVAPVKTEKKKTEYPNHATAGAEMICNAAAAMMLSNDEIDTLEKIVRFHMLAGIDGDLAHTEVRRNVYRFFRQTGTAGVLISILHLADILATYEGTLTKERWQKALSCSRNLLEAWLNQYRKIINPPMIVDGDDLMKEFSLLPGKFLGKVLEKIREAQASGEILNKKAAYDFVINIIERRDIS